MDRRGISAAALAKELGIKPPFVFAVKKGDRGIPPKRIDEWANALGLSGIERRMFIVAALLPKCPEPIRDYVRDLEGRQRD
jgi:hypothetical protein